MKQPAHQGRGKTNEREVSLLVAFAFFFMASASAFAGSKSSADFLKIPIGAQGAAVGQATTALTDGADALNWNPAGIAVAPSYANNASMGVSLTHQEHLVETSLDQVGIVVPTNGNRMTTLGVNLLRLTYGAQEQRSADRQKTGSFDAYDMALGFAAARNFGGLYAGAQLKLIRQQLGGYSAQGFALDLGIQGAGPVNRLYYGLAVKNLGPSMKFIEESFQLPLTISAGTAYRITGPLSLSVDVHSRPYQRQVSVSMGGQFVATRVVALRAGYAAKLAEAAVSGQRGQSASGNLGGLSGLGAGLGLRFSRFTLDYAMTPFGELGNSQTLTISSWFGGHAAQRDIHVDQAPDAGNSMLDVPLNHEDWWNRMR